MSASRNLPGAAPSPAWMAPEYAWPISLFAGFGGAWVGFRSGIPGLAPALSTGLFAPLFLSLLGRGLRRLALMLSAGWCLGIGAAIVACRFEYGWGAVMESLPGSWTWSISRLGAWRAAGEPGMGLDVTGLLATGLVLAFVVIAGRFGQGLPTIFLVAGSTAMEAAAISRLSTFVEAAGWAPVESSLLSIPPHALLTVPAVLALMTARLEPGPSWPPSWMVPPRRRLFRIGAILAVAGAIAQVLVTPLWAGWLAGRGLLGP